MRPVAVTPRQGRRTRLRVEAHQQDRCGCPRPTSRGFEMYYNAWTKTYGRRSCFGTSAAQLSGGQVNLWHQPCSDLAGGPRGGAFALDEDRGELFEEGGQA